MGYAVKYTDINSHRVSSVSCEIKMAGLKMFGIRECNHRVDLARAEFLQLIDRLGDGFGERSFLTTIAMFEPGPIPPSIDEIIGCRISSFDKAIAASSTDALFFKLNLHPVAVRINGKLIGNPRFVTI